MSILLYFQCNICRHTLISNSLRIRFMIWTIWFQFITWNCRWKTFLSFSIYWMLSNTFHTYFLKISIKRSKFHIIYFVRILSIWTFHFRIMIAFYFLKFNILFRYWWTMYAFSLFIMISIFSSEIFLILKFFRLLYIISRLIDKLDLFIWIYNLLWFLLFLIRIIL